MLVSFAECTGLRTSNAKLRFEGRAVEESEIEEPEKLKDADSVKDLDRAEYENEFQTCLCGQTFDGKTKLVRAASISVFRN